MPVSTSLVFAEQPGAPIRRPSPRRASRASARPRSPGRKRSPRRSPLAAAAMQARRLGGLHDAEHPMATLIEVLAIRLRHRVRSPSTRRKARRTTPFDVRTDQVLEASRFDGNTTLPRTARDYGEQRSSGARRAPRRRSAVSAPGGSTKHSPAPVPYGIRPIAADRHAHHRDDQHYYSSPIGMQPWSLRSCPFASIAQYLVTEVERISVDVRRTVPCVGLGAAGNSERALTSAPTSTTSSPSTPSIPCASSAARRRKSSPTCACAAASGRWSSAASTTSSRSAK